MHIPDNFLSTPVWATLNVVSLPAFGLMARRASRDLDESRIPLFGVLGAFVFAAQMINFPVGIGTSGHLVGGALLGCTIGPAAAAIVMTAILAIQALIFQDGGVLALGANVFNMAIAGVFAGYLPYHLWGARSRRTAVFAGGFLSVLVSASLALAELLLSGVPMPRPLVLVSLGLFCVSAAIEGAITMSVLEAVERLNQGWVRKPASGNRRTLLVLSGIAVSLVLAGFLMASAAPDGLERLGQQLGMVEKSGFHAPLADYSAPVGGSEWLRRASAGLAGLLAVYGVSLLAGRILKRRRSD